MEQGWLQAQSIEKLLQQIGVRYQVLFLYQINKDARDKEDSLNVNNTNYTAHAKKAKLAEEGLKEIEAEIKLRVNQQNISSVTKEKILYGLDEIKAKISLL